ncbi:histidine phosphatase family protein [archaeon]|jgi:broad specificity phosphatase PhoE|nr:histidine phosphatase family protein [archaeon]MBT4352435.1 histidine phosphatase family protein [archaeon]MBT4648036.1 histidine phosphatase family protein [archaeon]MBT6822710.1 histidine phosphatase family protein [archaeon]MBT7392453.1 histidine phosphatase family protein [archaeon]
MKLILVRHGETFENTKRILQGIMDTELNQKGIEQAQKVALRLKDEIIDVIYSSDLKRAANTSKEIAIYHQETPIYFVKELRERDFGSLTGKKFDEVDWKNLPGDIESEYDLTNRVNDFLDEVYDEHKEKAVLFVAHGGPIRSIIARINGVDPKMMYKKIKMGNTSVTIFEMKEDENHKVQLMNCMKHLY